MKVDQIPEEIIEAILVRLPVKSLVRFKCVSKSWSSLISSKQFVKNHLKFTTKNHKNNFLEQNCTYCSDVPSFFLNTYNSSNFLSVIGSCNGLCCSMIHLQQLLLWNPATREYKLLPHLDSLPFEYIPFGIGSDCRFGFGFDESHDDYKLVLLIRNRKGPVHYSVHLYSLRTDSWTRIEDIHGFGDKDLPFYGKLVNGRLHWAGTFGEERRILSFDLGTEEFGFVEQPTQKTCWAQVVDECLSLLCLPVSCEVDIWVMKEYGLTDSWCLVTRVSFLDSMFSLLLPLHLLPNGDIVYHNSYSELVVYSTKYNVYRTLPIKCQGLCLQHGVGATIQSLVSPN